MKLRDGRTGPNDEKLLEALQYFGGDKVRPQGFGVWELAEHENLTKRPQLRHVEIHRNGGCEEMEMAWNRTGVKGYTCAEDANFLQVHTVGLLA